MNQALHGLATITDELQAEVIRDHVPQHRLEECGVQEYLKALRNARHQLCDDPVMNRLTVYQRQDRSRYGDLVVGDMAPNIQLTRADTSSPIDLLRLQSDGRPLVLVCGSVS